MSIFLLYKTTSSTSNKTLNNNSKVYMAYGTFYYKYPDSNKKQKLTLT